MKFFIAMLCLSVSFAANAAIYKWKDKDGTTHYSDKPHKNAKIIDIPQVKTYTPKSPEQKTQPASEKKRPMLPEKQEFSGYQSVNFIEPLPKATIRDNRGIVPVNVELVPPLQTGHKIQALIDGKPYGILQKNNQFSLSGVNRGEHTIAVKILDEQNNVIAGSQPITFFMHQASKLINPQSTPQRPVITR